MESRITAKRDEMYETLSDYVKICVIRDPSCQETRDIETSSVEVNKKE